MLLCCNHLTARFFLRVLWKEDNYKLPKEIKLAKYAGFCYGVKRAVETAKRLKQENPECNIVVSGGQGPGEKISEAEAMKTYLLKKGIDEKRIFVEDKSRNTDENITFSSKIIKDNGLNENIAVATDGFHQFRASVFANENELRSSAISCKTRWYFSASYYSREVLAIFKMLLLKFF